ncbi:hypothetical protein like AT3G62070 [Hibiscus trionum]|uniref:Uncharacterized protein n=1 Tax=Hibiscus trionum TaxID=183268 RepID=A0A9W7LTD7_HIBTR|nr:hypothetical protein like AT3G62070 [Hibiscus trionum]
MTSDASTMPISSTEEDQYNDIDVWFDHDDDHQPHPHNFSISMSSMSTSSIYTSDDDDDMGMYMSRLSIESFDADADGEFSGEELLQLSSDSDKEPCYYSLLPAIPPHRSRTGVLPKEIKSKRKKKDGESSEGVVVITRPKGGRRSMCMDMEEVKACRELGFELEHERVVEMPPLSRFSSHSSSGGNWLISAPGDDPRDVKARLKVWAQAVARASTSMHCT